MSRPVLLFDVMDTLVYEPFHHEMPAFFGLSFDELMAAKHPTAWVEFEQRLHARQPAVGLAHDTLEGRMIESASVAEEAVQELGLAQPSELELDPRRGMLGGHELAAP